MSSPNTSRVRIDVLDELKKGSEAIRNMHKEVKSPGVNERRKAAIDKQIGSKVKELGGLLLAGLTDGAITGDPTGIIFAKTIWKSEAADKAAEEFCNANKEIISGLRLKLHGENQVTGGMWTRAIAKFKNGVSYVIERGKSFIQFIYKGITQIVKFVWGKIVDIAKWLYEKAIAFKNWVVGLFSSNKVEKGIIVDGDFQTINDNTLKNNAEEVIIPEAELMPAS